MTDPLLRSPDDSPAVLLARIDERVETLMKQVEKIQDDLDSKFVTKTEFDPVKKLAYGAVTAALMAVGGAILGLVIKEK